MKIIFKKKGFLAVLVIVLAVVVLGFSGGGEPADAALTMCREIA